MINYRHFEQILQTAERNKEHHLSLSYFSKKMGISHLFRNEIREDLMALVGTRLVLLFAMKCPHGHHDYFIRDNSTVTNGKRYCRVCTTMYDVSSNDHELMFNFISVEIQYLLDKWQKRQRPLLFFSIRDVLDALKLEPAFHLSVLDCLLQHEDLSVEPPLIPGNPANQDVYPILFRFRKERKTKESL